MNKRTLALLMVVLAIGIGLWRWSGSQTRPSTGLKLAVGDCLTETGPNRKVVLSVLSSGVVDINGKQVALDALPGQFHEVMTRDNSDRIYVRAENDTDFQSVIDVLNIAKAESSNVELLASRKSCPGDPPIPRSK